jgi:hypothetical protein
MEAMLGISLYSYFYLKLAKVLCLSYYLLCFLFNKIGEEGKTGFAYKQGIEGGEDGRGQVVLKAQMMNTHMNKCIDEK